MPNKSFLKGNLGVFLVLFELLESGIDSIPTPHFWIFDIVTENGIKIEVKFANIGIGKGGSGRESERFAFRISPNELFLIDFLVLVLNTKKGYQFYVIPKAEITGKTIAFNPFSRQESKYEKYQNRWDLIKSAIKKPKFTTYNNHNKPVRRALSQSSLSSCFTTQCKIDRKILK